MILSQHVCGIKMSKISIPSLAIQRFIKEARDNLINNDIVETMCYFLANQSEDGHLVDTVIFPNQTGTQSRVNDEGKTFIM